MDAMKLVRHLGEQHLWTHALRIVENDPQYRHQHIQQINLVHSHAHATVVALQGTHANAGLPGVRPGTCKPQYIETRATPAKLPGPDVKYVQKVDRIAQIVCPSSNW